jgi:tRNA(fMet)-specific endonuclease VapC
MTYLLDTNACIEHLRSKGTSKVSKRLVAQPPNTVFLCSIVKGELLAGIHRVRQQQLARAEVDKFFGVFASVPFDDAAAEHFGRVHASLYARGTPINAADLFIAAIALARDLIVVTHNLSDFNRIPGLRIEDLAVVTIGPAHD